jgi:hypothetical protein
MDNYPKKHKQYNSYNYYKKQYIHYKKQYTNHKKGQIGGNINNNTNGIDQYTKNQLIKLMEIVKDNYPTINDSYIKYNKIDIISDPVYESMYKSILLSSYMPFMPDPIKDEIKKKTYYELKYCNITYITTDNTSLTNLNILKRIITLNKILNFNNTKNPIIIYINCPNKKILPDNGEYIDVNNVNSGYSTNTYSVVFREEECLKVLVHELLHQFETDCGFDCHVKPKFSYNNINGMSRQLLLNESLVETLATILNIIFVLIEHNKLNIDTLVGMIIEETNYVIHQSCKILRHYNHTNYDAFIQTNIITGASIIEYYIYKALLLLNINKFVEFLTKDNRNILIFNRGRNREFESFINLLVENNIHQINCIASDNQLFANNNNTLRMTKFG